MRNRDIAATCIPVRFDDGEWETVFFPHVAGPESRHDGRFLKRDAVTAAVSATAL